MKKRENGKGKKRTFFLRKKRLKALSFNEILTLVISVVAITSSVLTPLLIRYFDNQSSFDLIILADEHFITRNTTTYKVYTYYMEEGIDVEAVIANSSRNTESIIELSTFMLVEFGPEKEIIIPGKIDTSIAVIESGSFHKVDLNYKIGGIQLLLDEVKDYKVSKVPTNYDPSVTDRDNLVKTYIVINFRNRSQYHQIYREINFLNSKSVHLFQIQNDIPYLILFNTFTGEYSKIDWRNMMDK